MTATVIFAIFQLIRSLNGCTIARYLSKAMAVCVITETLTKSSWMEARKLHMKLPKGQPM